MVNPIEGNVYATTRNLVAAYQCVMAGDTARTHRHTAAALRLVLAGKPGTYTVVNGARVDMAPGDVVLTPSWSWHGHVNETDTTSYWIDFLDIPFVQLTEAMFFEPHPKGFEDVTSRGPADGDSGGSARAWQRCQGRRDRQGGLPTIALALMRQPKGAEPTCRRPPRTISTRSSAARRASLPRTASTRACRPAMSSRCRAGIAQHQRRRRRHPVPRVRRAAAREVRARAHGISVSFYLT